jgi:ribosome-binding protein aMBF1 (putative translation factor)
MLIYILRSERFLGWSQEKLAQHVEVCVSSVSKWERREVEPQPKHRDKLKELAASRGYQQSDWPQKANKGPRAVPSKPSMVTEREDHHE